MDTDKTRILQITDTHLFAEAEGELMGVRTQATLAAVLDLIQTEYNDFHCLLVTGDLTQDGSKASYEHLKAALKPFNKPCYWLCGNHDKPETMGLVNPDATVQRVTMGNWQILLLNSQVTGAVRGHLDKCELGFLDKSLKNHPDKHTLIALHHHPGAIHSQWMDKIGLDNPEALGATISPHSNVKAIIHGHVHQDSLYQFQGIPVMATPSTCLQFAPNSDEFRVALSLPGFRVLDLLQNGDIESQVVRLTDFPMGIDLTSNGY